MALKKKPVTGMKDIMPEEMEIRDYVIGLIKDTYKTYGFQSMETPCVEHIENLCSKQGGDNEKLIFKIMKRGEKLKIQEAKEENDLLWPDTTRAMPMSCRLLLKRCRSAVCGGQTVPRGEGSASLPSVISTFWENLGNWQRLN